MPCPETSPIRSVHRSTLQRAAPAVLSDQSQDQVVLRIGMALVLTKALGLGHADFGPSTAAPLLLAVEILVDPMLPKQPLALADMAGEHLPLEIKHARDIHVEID